VSRAVAADDDDACVAVGAVSSAAEGGARPISAIATGPIPTARIAMVVGDCVAPSLVPGHGVIGTGDIH
jgi:hypothetical protein